MTLERLLAVEVVDLVEGSTVVDTMHAGDSSGPVQHLVSAAHSTRKQVDFAE